MYLLPSDEETPAINLNLRFDQIPREFNTFMNLLFVTLIVTIIYLILKMIDIVVTKSVKLYKRYSYNHLSYYGGIYDSN